MLYFYVTEFNDIRCVSFAEKPPPNVLPIQTDENKKLFYLLDLYLLFLPIQHSAFYPFFWKSLTDQHDGAEVRWYRSWQEDCVYFFFAFPSFMNINYSPM